MEGIWLASYLALWTLVILLGLVILVHSRLLGLLHHRIGPKGARALADGPALGARVDRLAARGLDGKPWVREFPAADDVVLVFISPQCETCNSLVPHLKDFVAVSRELTVVLVSTLDQMLMNHAYRSYAGLDGLTYLVGASLAADLRIEGTPYALYVDREGVVKAKGIVNNYEHLVSLKGHFSLAPPDASEPLAASYVRSEQ